MINRFILIIPFFIIAILFSCDGKQTNLNNLRQSEVDSVNFSDTLKFTSGLRAIYQDTKGNFWFGSHQEGVALYDGKTFKYFTTFEGLTDNQIRSIQEDQHGTIWFDTQNGISTYDDQGRIQSYTDAGATSEGEWMKAEHDLWFDAGIKEGVFRYDGNQLYYLALPTSNKSVSKNIYSHTGHSKGKNKLWIATYAGYFGYDGKDFSLVNDEALAMHFDSELIHVRSILEDSKGRLWIGNNGIGVLLQTGDSIINFSQENGLIHPSSNRRGDRSLPGTLEHVFTITEDKQGNIWFGDRDAGIWKYDGTELTNFTVEDGLTADMARSIYVDRSGQLWFGMEDGSVYTFNGQTFERRF